MQITGMKPLSIYANHRKEETQYKLYDKRKPAAFVTSKLMRQFEMNIQMQNKYKLLGFSS